MIGEHPGRQQQPNDGGGGDDYSAAVHGGRPVNLKAINPHKFNYTAANANARSADLNII